MKILNINKILHGCSNLITYVDCTGFNSKKQKELIGNWEIVFNTYDLQYDNMFAELDEELSTVEWIDEEGKNNVR